jgi:hypothetical protein
VQPFKGIRFGWGLVALLLCCASPTLTLAATGPPPVLLLEPISQVVLKNSSATFLVSALSGTTLTYKWRLNGSYIFGATNSSYTVTRANHDGLYSVEVINASGSVLSSNATLHVIDLPESANDSYTNLQNQTLAVPARGVMANDDNLSTLTAQALLVTDVSYGTLLLNPDGSFTYVPQTDFSGVDHFTYRVIDTIATGNVATVTIYVKPPNRPPVAQDDHAFTLQNTSVSINVLSNDSDPDNDVLSLVIATGPAHGTISASLTTTGVVAYMPDSNFFGFDSFTYNAVDPSGAMSQAKVTITVYNPADLNITSTAMTEKGFRLQLSGPAPATYVVLATTNFKQWTPIATNATLTGLTEVIDSDALSKPHRFYQAVAQPAP